MRRRDFITASLGGMCTVAAARALAQPPPTQSMTGIMDGSAHRPVRLQALANAVPVLDEKGVRELELGLKCQCTCLLDVHTCRTTDFSCPVSPAMHGDVLALVAGGYGAREITDAFVDVYGERVRMAPRATGFDVVAYAAPFAVMLAAALFVTMWIVRNIRRQRVANANLSIDVTTNATAEELERLREALRDDYR
jgi:cytochrome c-type biogenesis protein CcmH